MRQAFKDLIKRIKGGERVALPSQIEEQKVAEAVLANPNPARVMIVKPALWIPYGIKWIKGQRIQKKHLRVMMGWIKPVKCPTCRTYTRQIAINKGQRLKGMILLKRQCVSCLSTWHTSTH